MQENQCEMQENEEEEYKWYKVNTKHGYLADEVLSAFQKSIRRGKEEDAVFFAYELLVTSKELSEKFWQCVRIISVEDVALANPNIIPIIYVLHQNYLFCESKAASLHQGLFATVLLARSHKSRYIDELYRNLRDKVEREGYKRDIPDYALDKHTQKGREMGRDDLHFWEEASLINDDLSSHEKNHLREILQRLQGDTNIHISQYEKQKQ